jgi:coenzyme F420 hydrogenase subunit beta
VVSRHSAGRIRPSLIVVRTERGRTLVRRAIAAGYLTVERVEPWVLPASQPNLLRTRGSVWGRIWACRFAGVAAPVYRSMPAFRFWLSELSLPDKVRSLVGTFRRLLRRRRRARPIARAGQTLSSSAPSAVATVPVAR